MIRGIVVSHTHWDREWYLTFEEYRMRLLKVMKRVLKLLEEEPDFSHFMLDGQVAALEDYLEVVPQDEIRVRRLVCEGRLAIGPWYTQPDEFLVSAEALVRNLLIGIRTALRYGRAMMVGYLPDTFGHTPQLPQILRGFGIDSFVFMRGLGDEMEELGTEFVWEAPDGSRVLAIHLAEGYYNANQLGVREPYRYCVMSTPEGWFTATLRIYDEEVEVDLEEAYKRVVEVANRMLPHTRSRVLLLMNGCDHQSPQAAIPRIIEYVNSKSGWLRLVHGTLEDYISEARRCMDSLRVYRGEMRGAKKYYILSGTLSTRIYLKLLNYRSQLLLERLSEPLSVLAWLLGYEYPRNLLLHAWKLLLLNHAHDSICGSGTDPVHLEDEARFLRVIEVGSNLALEAARFLLRRGTGEAPGPSVLVFNPSGWRRTDFVRVVVPRAQGGYRLVGPQGEEAEAQVVEELPWGNAVVLGFVARDVPPVGYKVYRLVSSGRQQELTDGGRTIENEFLRVEADPERGGALRITDKRTGFTMEGVNVFVDEGDAGDEYNYSPPDEGGAVVSTSFRAEVRRVRGLAKSSLLISLRMRVPERLEGRRRSAKEVELPISVEVSLYPGVPRVDVRVRVDNRARDHRLRVMIPTGLKVDRSYAHTHFYVVERGLKPPEGDGWVERPSTTHPQLHWVDVSDGERGVMVANRGLPEYEVRDEGGAVVYLTLLRSVGWLSRDDLKVRKGHAGPPLPTPGAQCLRTLEFEYSIIPHGGSWKRAFWMAEEFTAPMLAVCDERGCQFGSFSLVEIEPKELVLTAVKLGEDKDWIIMRFYNISGAEVRGKLRFGFPVAEAWITDLNERPLKRLKVTEKMAKIIVQPHKIVTVGVRPRSIL